MITNTMSTRGLLLPDSEAASLSAPWEVKWEVTAIGLWDAQAEKEQDDVGN